MSAEQNKLLIGKLFAEGLNQRNFAIIDEIIGDEYVNHMMPDAKGPEGMRQVLGMFFDAFPDMKITVEHIIADGDILATRGHFTGTNNGSFMGAPASGKQIRAEYVDFWKMKDGKAVENWVQMDVMGIMMQIGAMTPPVASAEPA